MSRYCYCGSIHWALSTNWWVGYHQSTHFTPHVFLQSCCIQWFCVAQVARARISTNNWRVMARQLYAYRSHQSTRSDCPRIAMIDCLWRDQMGLKHVHKSVLGHHLFAYFYCEGCCVNTSPIVPDICNPENPSGWQHSQRPPHCHLSLLVCHFWLQIPTWIFQNFLGRNIYNSVKKKWLGILVPRNLLR